MRTETRKADGTIVAVGELTSLPGCSQVAVFHAAFVLPQHRHSGYGYQAHQERLDKAAELLYDYGLCTVETTNEYQVKNLQKAGWKLLAEFSSQRTAHAIQLYGKSI